MANLALIDKISIDNAPRTTKFRLATAVAITVASEGRRLFVLFLPQHTSKEVIHSYRSAVVATTLVVEGEKAHVTAVQ